MSYLSLWHSAPTHSAQSFLNSSTFTSSNRPHYLLLLVSFHSGLQLSHLLLYLFDPWGSRPFLPHHMGKVQSHVFGVLSSLCPLTWYIGVWHCIVRIQPESEQRPLLTNFISTSNSLKAFLLIWPRGWRLVGRMKAKENHMQHSPLSWWLLIPVSPLNPHPCSSRTNWAKSS